jgi:hypothetical protein
MDSDPDHLSTGKKGKKNFGLKKQDPDPFVSVTDPRIWIRINMSRIYNTATVDTDSTMKKTNQARPHMRKYASVNFFISFVSTSMSTGSGHVSSNLVPDAGVFRI